MKRTVVPDRFMARAAPVRVDLEHPIPVPGGEIAALWVRALDEKNGKLANSGFEGEVAAVADSVRLPREVVLDMAESDYDRVLDALDEALARVVSAGARTPAPRLVESEEA